MEFASNAKANAGLTTGIIGTAGFGLSLLNGLMGVNPAMAGAAVCHENMPVNRYEAEQQAKIAKLESDLALRDATSYVLGETGKLRDYVEAKFDRIECQLSDQKAYNAANNAALGCINGQIAQLYGLTKLVVPNTSVCPGWGNVTITPAAAPAAGA
jgi:hypothetical protein